MKWRFSMPHEFSAPPDFRSFHYSLPRLPEVLLKFDITANGSVEGASHGGPQVVQLTMSTCSILPHFYSWFPSKIEMEESYIPYMYSISFHFLALFEDDLMLLSWWRKKHLFREKATFMNMLPLLKWKLHFHQLWLHYHRSPWIHLFEEVPHI